MTELELLREAFDLQESLVSMRRMFHQNPELSFQERVTSSEVAAELKRIGSWSVRTEVGGFGVVAELTGAGGGRTVALRADMDALPIAEETGLPYASVRPNVMHACGHDAHTAMLLGAARLIARRRAELEGTVRLLFQSAEEINEGAKAMIAERALDGVDEIYGLHNDPLLPSGRFALRPGSMMGSVDRIEMTVEGKGGHGAIPDASVDPVVAAASIVMGLQTAVSREISPFEPAVVTIGSLQAGEAGNVIPSRARLTGTVRTFSPEVRRSMPERLERLVRKQAEAFRCRAELRYIEQVPVLSNDQACCRAAWNVLTRLAGEANLEEARPTMAGEDFSVYLQAVPGCFVWVGSGSSDGGEAYGLHHPKYTIDERCLPYGAAYFAAIAMERTRPGG